MSWNTQKVEDLKKLWNEGVATSRIGEQLGFTKNAVIGKAFRLGLERRQNSRKKTHSLSMYRECFLSNKKKREVYRETSTTSFHSKYSNNPLKEKSTRKKRKIQL